MINKKDKILIIAPHQDDEVIGCSSIISQYSENTTILYMIKLNDIKAANYLYGKKINIELPLHITGTSFKDQLLEKVPQRAIISSIKAVLMHNEINTVFMPYIHDANKDHQIVSNCANIACRSYDTYVKKLFMYEVPETTNLASIPFQPNYFNEFKWSEKESIISKYSEITKCHKQHPRYIESQKKNATYRGLQVYTTTGFAEAFQLVRFIG